MRKFIVPLQAVSMFLVLIGPFVDGHGFDFSMNLSMPHRELGFVLVFVGIVILLAAFKAMGHSFSVFPEPKANAELVTGGVFKATRNPMYFASLVISTGWTVAFLSVTSLIGLVLLSTFLHFKVGYEEQALRNRFGTAYEEYSKNVARLVPFLY